MLLGKETCWQQTKNNLPADLVLGVSAFLSGVSWQWLRIVRNSREEQENKKSKSKKAPEEGGGRAWLCFYFGMEGPPGVGVGVVGVGETAAYE